MSKTTILAPPPPPIEPIKLRDALEERYLAYALSTIMHRALPDVRDGLKPVHRRILYAMHQLRLTPDGGFLKCAKIVGDTMGDYHPHGNQAIYDALARLAQDFAVRYPLIDGQGNFGNIDGDNPAAERYTEARITAIAADLLEGIEEETVDFRPNYDGRKQEPVVLPAAFPNVLANGTSGIAVGMATSIPPHNLDELCTALLHLIKHPNAHIDKLVEMVPGPDFPTGGVIVEPREQILEAYRTGRGGFRLRAKWDKEDTGRGTYQIVVTEIPYQVQKAKLVERLAELMDDKKLPLLGDVRDELAETVRLVLEPKSRAVDPVLLMESLFRLTELEVRISLNMNVLSGGPGAGRAVAARRAQALAGAPPGRAGAALRVPPEEDRAPAGGARRLPDRLSQPRRGDPHRPLRGRAQGQAHQALQADRGAGRGDPQPAARSRCRGSRRSRSRPSTTSSARSGASSSRC